MAIGRISGALIAGLGLVGAGTVPAVASQMSPMGCTPETGVTITSHSAYRINAAGTYFKDGPGGTMTVSVTKTSTLSYSLSTSLEVSVSYLFASAKASVSGSITKSVAVTTGHTYKHDITKNKYGNMQYGTNGFKVGWKSYQIGPSCTTKILKTGTAILPVTSVGWKYWETSS